MLAVVSSFNPELLLASLSTTISIEFINGKMGRINPPKILSMVGDIRKDAVTRVAAITRNVMAPLVTITVAVLRFLFSFLSFLLLSASSNLVDVVIPLKFEIAMLADLSISMAEILSIRLGRGYWPKPFRPIIPYWPERFRPIIPYWPEPFQPIIPYRTEPFRSIIPYLPELLLLIPANKSVLAQQNWETKIGEALLVVLDVLDFRFIIIILILVPPFPRLQSAGQSFPHW
jgi:hypothetical protein